MIETSKAIVNIISLDSTMSIGVVIENNSGIIKNVYAEGTNVSSRVVGGIVGYNNSYGEVINSYSVVKNGAICQINLGAIKNSYWDIEKSGIMESLFGIGKTTLEMNQKSIYENWNFERLLGGLR